MNKVYPGLSMFLANRPGNHNWFDNPKRPFLSGIDTQMDGTKRYVDLFLNTEAVEVKVSKTHTTIKVPNDVAKPLVRCMYKPQ